MDRRKFICGITAAGATARVNATAAAAPKETAGVNWKVNGFTCVTCAVGLEVMLRGMRGVVRAKASYPENTVAIGFDSHLTNEKTLREFISACGFQVA
jgi:copper chaperone CopZ